MKNINIAIDGPSGAGKSTISDLLAEKLGYAHLDTGAMYRTLALYCIRNGVDMENEDMIAEAFSRFEYSIDSDGNIYLDGEDVSSAIRANEISMAASSISRFAKVRSALVKKQQEIASCKGYIVDGRDIGTVVLTDAELKLFLTASAEDRARRRVLQYAEKGVEADYEQILADIVARDYQDTHRENSPLKKADDAIEIDSSFIGVDEVVNICYKYALAALDKANSLEE